MVFMSEVTDTLNMSAELSTHDLRRHNGERLGRFDKRGARNVIVVGPSQHATGGPETIKAHD